MSNFFICCYFKQALPFKKLFYSFQGPHLLGRKWFVTINLNFRIYDNLFNPWYSLIFGLIWCVCPTYLPWSTLNSLELPGGGGKPQLGNCLDHIGLLAEHEPEAGPWREPANTVPPCSTPPDAGYSQFSPWLPLMVDWDIEVKVK